MFPYEPPLLQPLLGVPGWPHETWWPGGMYSWTPAVQASYWLPLAVPAATAQVVFPSSPSLWNPPHPLPRLLQMKLMPSRTLPTTPAIYHFSFVLPEHTIRPPFLPLLPSLAPSGPAVFPGRRCRERLPLHLAFSEARLQGVVVLLLWRSEDELGALGSRHQASCSGALETLGSW